MVEFQYFGPTWKARPTKDGRLSGRWAGVGEGGSGAPAAHEEDELDVTLMLLHLERGSERGRSARPAGFGPPTDMDLDDFISTHELLHSRASRNTDLAQMTITTSYGRLVVQPACSTPDKDPLMHDRFPDHFRPLLHCALFSAALASNIEASKARLGIAPLRLTVPYRDRVQ